jgi:O-antigen ligase
MVASADRIRRLPGPLGPPLAVGLLGAVAGIAVAQGGIVAGAVAGGALLFAIAALSVLRLAQTRPFYMTVEVPVFFLLIATLTLRYTLAGGPRTGEELTSDPFDIFSLFKLGCTGIALALGLIALLSPARGAEDRITSRSIRIYYAYGFIVVLGLTTSVHPLLTSYRAIEVVAGLTVLAGAYKTMGRQALARIERMLYWYAVLLISSIWVGVVVVPSAAVERINSPIPLRVQGVFPHVSSDTMGHLSVVLIMWSLARILARRVELGPRMWLTKAIVVFGFISLIAAQYRTGYASLLAALGVLLFIRGRKAIATLALAGVLVISVAGSGVIAGAQPYLLRGQDVERASRLQGRLTYWSYAIPVWQQSPIIGGGLETATRLVALPSLAGSKKPPQNVHSTWVEALVGTGVVGVSLLAAALLLTYRRALAMALRGGRLVPVLLLTVLMVRSFTGGSIEQGGDTSLLFLTLAWGLRDAYFTTIRPQPCVAKPGKGKLLGP